ncbi:hypothetical protein CRUP_006469 [Coryphaenoides rupestris]|nr:hypothetical protein CRUP_006469 [Coryphaenoides rupestris]
MTLSKAIASIAEKYFGSTGLAGLPGQEEQEPQTFCAQGGPTAHPRGVKKPQNKSSSSISGVAL